jgi:transposase
MIKGKFTMSIKCVEVKTLHGYTVEQLRKIARESANSYTRSMLMAVIMRYNGINTNDIMETLGKSRATVTAYINKWNQDPKSMMDQRGGNISSRLTDEMVEEIKTALQTRKPCEYGYEQSTWTTALLAQR